MYLDVLDSIEGYCHIRILKILRSVTTMIKSGSNRYTLFLVYSDSHALSMYICIHTYIYIHRYMYTYIYDHFFSCWLYNLAQLVESAQVKNRHRLIVERTLITISCESDFCRRRKVGTVGQRGMHVVDLTDARAAMFSHWPTS